VASNEEGAIETLTLIPLKPMFKTVLFPIDQSRESKDASSVVANIVKTYGSKLILLSVVERNPPTETPNPDNVMADEEEVAKLLEAARSLFSQQGIESEVLEREGMPSFVICDVADEISADLIIMACRGLGLTDEGAHDSVTSKVINLSPCPVLIVP
jgi:nucleotide-binding universal stress UspA family protein